MPILILGEADDDHAAHMMAHLVTRGVEAEFLDSRAFPSALAVAYDPAARSGTLRLREGRRLDFEQIAAVYWRCYNGIDAPPLPDAEQAHLAQNDSRSLFESLLIDLPARWVNGWRAYQLHQTKPVQLAMVSRLGIPVPASLLANDPEAILHFAAQHRCCVFKPVQGGAHARRLTPDHLRPENLKNLAFAPVTLQEEVPGANIRVFVAGRRVFACQVQTESLDYRDDPDPTIRAVELPDAIAEQCLAIAGELELLWTGIDWRRTPDGQYVFLEANPSPMFLGFESSTGQPLTEALASVLLGSDS
jgi:hypothetical protein